MTTQREAIASRLDEMKEAPAGSRGRTIVDRAIASDSTWSERARLVDEARRAAPGLDHLEICGAVEEWYDLQTGGAESGRKAARVEGPKERELPVPDPTRARKERVRRARILPPKVRAHLKLATDEKHPPKGEEDEV